MNSITRTNKTPIAINISKELHRRFKIATVTNGDKMTDILEAPITKAIEQYLTTCGNTIDGPFES